MAISVGVPIGAGLPSSSDGVSSCSAIAGCRDTVIDFGLCNCMGIIVPRPVIKE
ncbi:MAG: hypothetical protein U0235_29550 [Polyangiaceae bacterium]